MNENSNGVDLYRAAGELAGVTRLVDAFYSNMDTFPEARVIRKMHPEEFNRVAQKNSRTFCAECSAALGSLSNITAGSTSLIFIGNSQLEHPSETHGCSVCNMPFLFSPMRHHLKSIYWLDCGFQRKKSGWSMRQKPDHRDPRTVCRPGTP